MIKTITKELEKWWGSVLEVTPDDIKSDTIKVVSDKDIERLLQSVFEEIEKEFPDWCAEYMALGNHNLEYNHRTPPIWKFMESKFKSLRQKYCNSELKVKNQKWPRQWEKVEKNLRETY